MSEAARPRALVVDDEDDIRELVAHHLARSGFRVEGVASGEEALEAVTARRPDVVVLDLMLPGVDGLEVCRRLRQLEGGADLPIVMVTARDEEAEVVAGLELGADDYLTKPFSPRVLVARLRAVMRRRARPGPAEGEPVRHGLLWIHPGRREVRVDGRPVSLTETEFRTLLLLASRPGWVFTRQQILDAAQGEDAAVTSRAVDVHVVSIRRKLGPCAELVETVRGVGYRLRDEEDQ